MKDKEQYCPMENDHNMMDNLDYCRFVVCRLLLCKKWRTKHFKIIWIVPNISDRRNK